MLETKSISRVYGDRTILRDVTVQVAPGKACIVVGPSGAGKSTLLRCAGLLEFADRGEVHLDGKPILAGSVPPWPELTVVFQQHFLWPHLTLRRNITLPLEEKMPADAIRRVLLEMEELFDMNGFLDRYPNEASLGQRQRVALARALALGPRYILLDEVTSSLDVEQIEKLFRHLLVLLRRGIGVLMVTHHLGLARALLGEVPGSHVLFLDEGSIAGSGGLDLLSRPPSGRVAEFVARMELAS